VVRSKYFEGGGRSLSIGRSIGDVLFRGVQHALKLSVDLAKAGRHLTHIEMNEKGPNKAPEPTPGAVTPRAIEGVSR